MAQEPVLVVDAICKKYHGLSVVDNVSFQVAKGECFALLGPNGAGKTTTCEIVEGLTVPDSGSVAFAGLPNDSDHVRNKMGVLLQDTSLYGKYTVRETLELFASFYQENRDVKDVIDDLALYSSADKRVETLSGGQKQRLYFGCALVNDPEYLFLDEPTTGLDPAARNAIWELIARLKARGQCAIVLTTHNMEEAERLSDSFAILRSGKVVAKGSTAKILKQFSGRHFVNLCFSSPLQSEESKMILAKMENYQSSPNVASQQLSGTVTNLDQFIRGVTQVLDSSKQVSLESCEVKKYDLEDLFLDHQKG